MSYRDFPRLVYQISSKFRDEHKPKAGLLRSREFLMKDLYSFHINQKDAEEIYDNITKAYKKIFSLIGIPTFQGMRLNDVSLFSISVIIRVMYNIACILFLVDSPKETGVIKANEYYYKCNAGDDKIYICSACKNACSASLIIEKKVCPSCLLYAQEVDFCRGLEVGI